MVTKIFKPNSCSEAPESGSTFYTGVPLSWEAHDGTYRMLIQHNYGRRPKTLVLDSNGDEVIALVRHLTKNLISIKSNIQLAGSVIVL